MSVPMLSRASPALSSHPIESPGDPSEAAAPLDIPLQRRRHLPHQTRHLEPAGPIQAAADITKCEPLRQGSPRSFGRDAIGISLIKNAVSSSSVGASPQCQTAPRSPTAMAHPAAAAAAATTSPPAATSPAALGAMTPAQHSVLTGWRVSLAAREAALDARESAVQAREASVGARETAISSRESALTSLEAAMRAVAVQLQLLPPGTEPESLQSPSDTVSALLQTVLSVHEASSTRPTRSAVHGHLTSVASQSEGQGLRPRPRHDQSAGLSAGAAATEGTPEPGFRSGRSLSNTQRRRLQRERARQRASMEPAAAVEKGQEQQHEPQQEQQQQQQQQQQRQLRVGEEGVRLQGILKGEKVPGSEEKVGMEMGQAIEVVVEALGCEEDLD